MKQEELTITLCGKDERLLVASLLQVVRDSLHLLDEVDKRTKDEERHEAWRIKKCVTSSPLTLTMVRLVPRQGAVRDFLGALRAMEESTNAPSWFTDSALERCKYLVSALNNGVSRLVFSSPGEHDVAPTQRVAANVDEILHTAKGYYFIEDMEVEGRLDVIDVHGEPIFQVFDPLTDDPIECAFPSEHIEEVLGLFRKRVRVRGVARFNRKHQIVSVSATAFVQLRERHELPQLCDLHKAGIDITGGRDSADYIREIRDGR